MKTLIKQEKKDKIKRFIKKSFEKAFIGITALTLSCGGVETDGFENNTDGDNNNNVEYKEVTYTPPTTWDAVFEDSYDASFRNKFTENQLKFIEWLDEQCKMDVTSKSNKIYFGDVKEKILYSTHLENISAEIDGTKLNYVAYNEIRMIDTTMNNSRHRIASFDNGTSNRLGLRFSSVVPSSTTDPNDYYWGRRTGTHYPKGFGWDTYRMKNVAGNIESPDFQDGSFVYTNKDISYVHICKTVYDKNQLRFFLELLILPSTDIQDAISKFNLTKQDIEKMENLTP